MICTATINGVAVEINGTPEECWNFFHARPGIYSSVKLPSTMDWMKPWEDCPCGSKEHQKGGHGKHCDPLARHYGNCGAKDCPIIDPAPKCKGHGKSKNWITTLGGCDIAICFYCGGKC